MFSGTSVALLTNYVLTGTATASTSASIGGNDQHSFYMYYTPTASGRILTWTIETTSDNELSDTTNRFMPDGYYKEATSGDGLPLKVIVTYTFTSTSTSIQAIPPVEFPRSCNKIRIKVSESGGGGGSLSVVLLSHPTAQ